MIAATYWKSRSMPGRSWGQLLSEKVIALGGDALDLSRPCRHVPELVRIKRYSQRKFFMCVDGIDRDEEERKWQEERARRAAAASTGGSG